VSKHTSDKKDCSTLSTCPYCGVGCGVKVSNLHNETTVAGDISHPANLGQLCSKGYALADTLTESGRLLEPTIDGKNVSWDSAISRIGDEFRSTIEEYGPEAIAFYVSGQLLTEDYYVANKFVKGYLGTANIDTNSRLCMASSVAGHKRAFGSDTVPGCYEDLELADVVVLVGSNLSWCHPVLFQRIEKAKRAGSGLQVVVIDPRATATAELADLHLPIQPGGEQDAVLFNGLLRYLILGSALDQNWIEQHTNDFEGAASACMEWDIEHVAESTGLSVQKIEQFYQLFLQHDRTVTVYSQGVNQSHQGTDTVNSITNVHLATGRIGKPGCGPFSITGQPNAMGGREVGGLANMLACHMEIENPEHQDLVQRYWNSPSIAQSSGLKAVDLFKSVKAGKIKALWVMATNPADSMPRADEVAKAIAACPFVVVSDVSAKTDTVELATVTLPARAWSEKCGTVTNSERRISRQRAFKTAPALAKPDWWAICSVAKNMGFADAFAFESASEIFREYAGLSAFENNGKRDFDIGACANMSEAEYDGLTPFQWPMRGNENEGTSRLFSNGGFFTADGKARFLKINLDSEHLLGEGKNANETKAAPSFVLNSGRIRDQWHTMTRTGNIPNLSSHIGEPFAEINPADASNLGISDACVVDVSSESGRITVRAQVTDRIPQGSVFVPMHWSDAFASNARVNVLVHDVVDPVSGQPALKNQLVKIESSDVSCYGFMLSSKHPDELQSFDYWAVAAVDHGWKVEFASSESPLSIAQTLQSSLLHAQGDVEMLSYEDHAQGSFRFCWFSEDQLVQAVYISREPVVAARQVLSSLFSHKFAQPDERLAVLSGVGFADQPDTGSIVCSCLSVGSKTILQSIESGCLSVDQVGEACGAGTQCGSCRSDVSRILKECVTIVEKEAVA